MALSAMWPPAPCAQTNVAKRSGVVAGSSSTLVVPPSTGVRHVATGAAEPAWRLRGMATAEPMRSSGVGTAVLAAVVDHVQSNGGGLLWCNARLPAVPFYERNGFTTRGESWVDPDIGPHVAMERTV